MFIGRHFRNNSNKEIKYIDRKDLPCKSIIELLQLLLIQVDTEEMKEGLCSNVFILFRLGKITSQEYYILNDYIRNNKPFFGFRKWFRLNLYWWESAYWWEPGRRSPRVKWIKRRICKEIKKL